MSQPGLSLSELGAAVLEAQPFSRLLGTELLSITPDAVELGLDVTDDLRQQYGMAHGGVIAYLADNALTFAGGIALSGDVLTAQMNIHYLNPARGSRLIARARSISCGRSSALTECDIIEVADEEERKVAFATGSIRRVEPRK